MTRFLNFLRRVVLCLAIAFALTLTLSAIALGMGFTDLANRYAEVAYVFLVACVIAEMAYVALEARRTRSEAGRS